jgi:hypothetical protein
MSTEQLGRRQLLGRAGLITGGAVVVAAGIDGTPSFAAESDQPALLGGWLSTREDPGEIADGVFTFSGGGVIHYQDLAPSNIILQGSWRAGRRTLRYNMWGTLPADLATSTPSLVAQVTGTGTYTSTQFNGPYRTTLYLAETYADGAGDIVFEIDGTVTGRRLNP